MNRNMLRTTFAVVLAGTSLWAAAQAYPDRQVHLIVPQSPGGASDALARTVGQKLGEKWKQPVVIENKPGAGGNIGMEHVLNLPADGYTLLMTYAGTHAINGSLYKNLRFNIERDLIPVATIATLPFVAVTGPNGPKTFAELVQRGKSDKIFFGSAGNGSVNHLLGEMVNSMASTKLQHVPYKGAAPALQDLMAGQVQVVFTSLPSVAGLIRSGQLRPLAVTSARRSASFPDIPTIAESGLPSFDVMPWFGIVARVGTPASVIQKVNADVRELLADKDVIEKLGTLGAEPLGTTNAEFATIIKNDIAKWSEAVKSSGARVD